MANTLFLRLEGPMQSWGERARWSVRDTSSEPTKSGVIGLLGCSIGLSADEDLRQLSRQVRMGVRCDLPGTTLVDYHTVTGGVLSAEGKVKKTASTGEVETVVSWRHYLCDASFLVAVQSTPDLIHRMAEALQDPHWPVYLGRKSCPPGRPPFDGVGDYQSLQEALEAAPFTVGQDGEKAQVRGVLECSPAEGIRRRDEIGSRSRRSFLPRYTRDVPLTVIVNREE